MADLPFDECVKSANTAMRQGMSIHQKFTCGFCGIRQTMSEPNRMYRQGECEECGEITQITQCGFMAVIGGNA